MDDGVLQQVGQCWGRCRGSSAAQRARRKRQLLGRSAAHAGKQCLCAARDSRQNPGRQLECREWRRPGEQIDQRLECRCTDPGQALARTSTDSFSVVLQQRKVLSSFPNMEELIRIGAYRQGADPAVDRAIILNPAVEDFLRQGKDEYTPLDESFTLLGDILSQA